VLPMLDLPAGLEDRILSSVKEAQKVVPIQSRASRFLSLAGSWAMRPQTAMAAVFLLMIGTSAFVIRSRHSSERAAAVSVTEQGEPAGQVAAPEGETASLDNKAAAAAHGPNQPAPITAPPVATPSPAASGAVALNERSERNNNDPFSAGLIDGVTAGKGRASKNDESLSFGSALAEKDKDSPKKEEAQRNKVPENRGGEDEAKKVARRPSDISNAGPAAGAPAQQQDYAPRGQAVATPPATRAAADSQQDGFSAGMAAYRTRNYAEATRQFDGAARSGDQNAALWAAKAVKDGNGGCGAAMPRFDAVAQKSSGTWIGSEAQLESARCQIASGQLDAAREKLGKLTKVASHAPAAQQALNELNQVAQKRDAERSRAGAGGGGAARPAAPAPVRAPAKPAATALDQAGF
jgi:hypothetical protein